MQAAALSRHPARLVLIQDGADDIDFAHCLLYQLASVGGVGLGLGTRCIENGAVTPALAAKLADVRTSLASAIEGMAPDARTIAVLDYYQPIPDPSQIADDTSASHLHTNLVCSGLKANAASTATAAQIVLGALNHAIAGAVADARAQHVTNVVLVNVATAFDGHGICTADPFVFSGEPVPDATLAADGAEILAAKSCTGTDALHGAAACTGLTTRATQAEADLEEIRVRAPHTPTRPGSERSPWSSSTRYADASSRWRAGSDPTNSAAPSGPPPSRRRRTRAEPTTTPSATSHTSAAWSGVETPTPTQTGMSRVTPDPLDHLARSAPRRPAPRSPPCGTRHRRTPPPGRRSARPGPPGSTGPPAGRSRCPAASASCAHGSISSSERSGMMAPLTPAATRERAMRLWPARKTML